jgi:hypothetical protein
LILLYKRGNSSVCFTALGQLRRNNETSSCQCRLQKAGKTPPKGSRPVGYGVIRADGGIDSMMGVTKPSIGKLNLVLLYMYGLRVSLHGKLED